MPKRVVTEMIDFVIRSIVPDDAEAIAMLWLLCTAEVAENEPIFSPNVSAEALAETLRTEFNAGTRFGWIVEVGGGLAGYVTCQVQEEVPVFSPRKYIYVNDLDVAPAYRQRGLSRVLMQEVTQYARSQGIHRLELGVVWGDPRSRRVWERHGFKPHILYLHKDLEPR
ncbi:GNAT family N-acetyltransferase [uncultured Desulfosarcina sp.]|uniref:GNAT family N-acetyltransferase n=1 Tax=uncultured Desulfosarcina sp. TaxID=218289 RepID=UPI0029C6CF47|nr:GNAT family N-acetyltransferase [uncultured Desulfosarcina sp.]